MNWKFIDSGSNTGKYNMEFDLDLAQNCTPMSAVLRFYRWQPYCISLGANQKIEDINIVKTNEDNLEVVKRPTGGRAILHAEELTYSVVMPLSWGLTSREIYTKISVALVRGLKLFNPGLAEAELENVQPNFPALLSEPSGALCFASTAKSEVKFKGKKIIGSAQRKLGNVVLQHGSILCGQFHSKLPLYLNCSLEESKALLEEMKNKTIDLNSILGINIDYNSLKSSLLKGFEEEWNIKFNNR